MAWITGSVKQTWSLLFFSPDRQAPSQSDFPTSAVKGDRHNYLRHTSKPSATRQKTGFPVIMCQVLRRPFLDSKDSSISSIQPNTPRSLVQDAVGSQVLPEAPGSGGATAGLGSMHQGPPPLQVGRLRCTTTKVFTLSYCSSCPRDVSTWTFMSLSPQSQNVQTEFIPAHA